MLTDPTWNRKTLTLLHDPPEKAYDLRNHEARASHYARLAGLDEFYHQQKEADWEASAADRMVFPPNKHGFGQGVAFRHPLTGSPATLDFPDRAEAEKWLDDTFPAADQQDPRIRHWTLWRTWMQNAASQEGAGALPYLPADTRIPDGSIWTTIPSPARWRAVAMIPESSARRSSSSRSVRCRISSPRLGAPATSGAGATSSRGWRRPSSRSSPSTSARTA